MLLGHWISLLEWFLKDHVTLKPGDMAAENLGINSFLKYIYRKLILNFNNNKYINNNIINKYSK